MEVLVVLVVVLVIINQVRQLVQDQELLDILVE
jgi:hypothetical protein